MSEKYTITPIQDMVLEEIKKAGFVDGSLHRVSKVVIKLDQDGVCYGITYGTEFPNEAVSNINAEESEFIHNLGIETRLFSKCGELHGGLYEVIVTVEANKIPEVHLKYEILTKGS